MSSTTTSSSGSAASTGVAGSTASSDAVAKRGSSRGGAWEGTAAWRSFERMSRGVGDETVDGVADEGARTEFDRLAGPLSAPGSARPSHGDAEAGSSYERTSRGRAAVDEAARDLVELTDCVRDAERKIARAVLLAADVVAEGTCERIEGMDLELWLANVCRLIASDRKTLLAASDVLASMPTLSGLFADGKVSWGQVRAITSAARRLDADDRAWLDTRIEATCERWGGLDGYDPDELLAAVDLAVTELTDVSKVHRREERQVRSYFALQSRFDGTSRFWGEADRFDTPLLASALDRAAAAARRARAARAEASEDATGGGTATDTDTSNDESAGTDTDVADTDVGADDDLDGTDLSGLADDEITDLFAARRRRGRRRFDGLRLILGEWMGGSTGRVARPAMLIHLPLELATEHAAGRIDTGLVGSLPTISAALTDLLARDADLRAVIFDGARPLAVSKKIHAEDIPAATRVGVVARDRTDRMPGSQLPIDHIHHATERSRGGDHHPDGLVGLSEAGHGMVHRHGWRTKVDPATGEFTIRRAGRTFRSLPAGTPLEPSTRPPPGPKPQRRRSRPRAPTDDTDLPF